MIKRLLCKCRRKRRCRDAIDGGVRKRVDTDAPKTIASQQIVSFYCRFSTLDRMRSDTELAGNVFTLQADASGGSMKLRYSTLGPEEQSFAPSPAFFGQLQQLVVRYDLARHNGQHYRVSGLPPDFGVELKVCYDSGESIHTTDNQNCFLSIDAMEALVELFQSA